MASSSTTTTDHDEIRTWVEQHDGGRQECATWLRGGTTFFELVSR
ncbi:MAG TPA: hypothetical protein VJN29_13920 [Intrasporangium sp.]|nr:hypothetical protein [Intrasporangium sp.]HKX68311.1 hypothetical protein [Intrasporangium sp.]